MEVKYQEIGEQIKKGALIIYPTDTVYGIGASIQSEEALIHLYQAKSRNFSSPLIALVDSVERISEIAYVERKKELLEKLSQKFWPGGLTIILPAKDCVPKIMISGGNTVGVRIPNHEMALSIIRAAGGILPTTSANISGEATPSSYQELSEAIKRNADIVIDGGVCPVGEASTILDFTKDSIQILRLGAITKEEIEAVIGKI
ncbi:MULTISPECIES: L-threonylcarbamoyladenylate synthase [Fusobacterium]|uniref:L-threonylcarbamoyladenylate synthase n=1 Tax=Fusobacterium equinum TaxID=134605 RepID=A0A133NFD2_9FUSO|nr:MULTISPECIES: L-threonylcarbamoyladenylate synthase [Fusobacterium]AVQ16564.1 threonylcarbamoyl-AMP synthase [Fusobacterium gonidiaformans ATCC 25563]EFS28135.1 Sua5/YciO/YrdC/YwlC family protein [Fusobacterium gonidiaformans ATCC 25563]KXA14979.1 Sua5/YciO/YrdC/YwlC family protein [Fusobacterium equinum]